MYVRDESLRAKRSNLDFLLYDFLCCFYFVVQDIRAGVNSIISIRGGGDIDSSNSGDGCGREKECGYLMSAAMDSAIMRAQQLSLRN
jgi:hypothetical protein